MDHYTEEHELDTWNKYKQQFANSTPEANEVVFRAFHVRDKILKLIRSDSKIKNVVNFGCSYGWLEHQLALSAPNVHIWGIDRSVQAMELNRCEFGLPNCSFVATDIFDFILNTTSAINNAVFCHINIGVYFLPEFIKKLYDAVYSAGGIYLLNFEPSGFSRQIHDYYHYSLRPKDPVVFRGVMLLNNYPNLMQASGFEVISGELVTPPHPHPDFRSVTFIARGHHKSTDN